MRLFHPTARLCRELARVLPERPFSIEFWDGGRVRGDRAADADVLRAPGVRDRARAARPRAARARPRLRRGVARDRRHRRRVPGRRRLGAAADRARATGRGCSPRSPSRRSRRGSRAGRATELLLPGERHSPERDAEAIRYHYDVGNEFFALFLDPSMTYSCALFSRGAQTLEEAQRAKLDLIAQKLELKAGQRVLDVGCGWGSFAIHAARDYGVSVTGITLSPSQAELARSAGRRRRASPTASRSASPTTAS